ASLDGSTRRGCGNRRRRGERRRERPVAHRRRRSRSRCHRRRGGDAAGDDAAWTSGARDLRQRTRRVGRGRPDRRRSCSLHSRAVAGTREDPRAAL
ncbi:MAG: hypothetical protein AVDCRST_MAG88-2603, partial [uncultured Thermomicrobiales bacterium]